MPTGPHEAVDGCEGHATAPRGGDGGVWHHPQLRPESKPAGASARAWSPTTPPTPSASGMVPAPGAGPAKPCRYRPGDVQPGHLVDSLPGPPPMKPSMRLSGTSCRPPPAAPGSGGPRRRGSSELAALYLAAGGHPDSGASERPRRPVALGDGARPPSTPTRSPTKGNRSRTRPRNPLPCLALGQGRPRHHVMAGNQHGTGKKRSPARRVETDNHPVIKTDNRYSKESDD